jgi:transcription initiation factor TFIIB
MPYHEKEQNEQFQRIKNIAQNAGISMSIINDAMHYHKKITEYGQTFRAENKDGLIAASIYISCRVNNYPRTPKEIATIFNLNNMCATRGCKKAQLIINQLEQQTENTDKTVFCKIKPELFIERYCSKLNVNTELTQLCEFICHIVNKNNLMPQNAPHSIASGIIYYISQLCKLNISKTDIKHISEISEVTINKCYRKLLTFDKNLLIPSELQKKYDIL